MDKRAGKQPYRDDGEEQATDKETKEQTAEKRTEGEIPAGEIKQRIVDNQTEDQILDTRSEEKIADQPKDKYAYRKSSEQSGENPSHSKSPVREVVRFSVEPSASDEKTYLTISEAETAEPEEETTEPEEETAEPQEDKSARKLPSVSLEIDLTEEQIRTFTEAFDLFDVKGDGTISMNRLKHVLQTLGLNFSENDMLDIMLEVDTHGDGTVELDVFLAMMSNRLKEEQESREDLMRKAFEKFDIDEDGYIDLFELILVMKRLGETLTLKDAVMMILEVDQDGDFRISFEEFCAIMSSREDLTK